MTGHKSVFPPAEWDAPLVAFAAWMRLRDMSPQSIELRTYHVRRFGTAISKPPFEVSLDDLLTFLGSQAWGKNTLASVSASLKVFYGWAEQTGRVPRSPAANLPRIKPPTPKPKPIPEDALTATLADVDQLVGMAIRLSASIGMRRGEVAAVHIDDLIDTPDGYLLRILGKGRKERIIPIGQQLAADLIAWIDTHGEDGYAFPAPGGGHLTPHWLGTLVSRALPDGYTMHKLRHRALTRTYDTTKDIILTATLAGHSSVATTQAYYVEPNYDALRAAVEGIAS